MDEKPELDEMDDFDEIPNAETLRAFAEAETLKKDPNTKFYNSFDEILAELEAEEDEEDIEEEP